MNEYKSPIPSRIYNAAVGGHICGTEDIIDDAKNKTQKQINSEVEESLGTGGSVDARIASAVATEATRAQTAEEQLRTLYNNLQQSKPIPVTELPATGEAGKIYRLAGTTSYADYMYAEGALTTPIKMAEYDNAIDDEPIPEGSNLVKSGGIYKDINDATKLLLSLSDDTFEEKTTIPTTWEVGNIDNAGQDAASSSHIRTTMLSKEPYRRIYYSGRYHASGVLYLYEDDGTFVKSISFAWNPIDSCDKYTKFRIKFYVGTASITDEEHDVTLYNLVPKSLVNLSDYKNSTLFNLSKYVYSPTNYTGNWNKNGNDYYVSDIITKGLFGVITIRFGIYSMNGNIYFYENENDDTPAYTYQLSGSGKNYEGFNIAASYKFFKVSIYYTNVTNLYTPEEFAKYVIIKTYYNDSNRECKLLNRTDNILAHKSFYDSTLQILKNSVTNRKIQYSTTDSNIEKTIEIRNQEDYDNLVTTDLSSIFDINTGAINIIFKNGIYNINHLFDISNINKPNLSINLIGDNSVIECFSTIYDKTDAVKMIDSHYGIPYTKQFSYDTIFIDDNGNHIDIVDSGLTTAKGCHYATTQVVEVQDSGIETDDKVFKFGVPEIFNDYIGKSIDYFKDSYLYLSSSYIRIVCKIYKFERDNNIIYVYVSPIAEASYLYEKEADLSNFMNSWYNNAVNYLDGEALYAPFYIKNAPRCTIPGTISIHDGYIYIPNTVNKIFECDKATQFLKVSNCSFKELSISGFNFNGHCGGDPKTIENYIKLFNVSNVIISDNSFKNINSTCISCSCDFVGGATKDVVSYSSDNIKILNNTFFNCSLTGISAIASNLIISDNKLDKCGNISYSSPIGCSGKDIIVCNNEIKNFAWSGISTNSGKGWWVKGWCNGIIEHNIIYNDKEWNSKLDRNCLNDKGAIYNYVYHDGLHISNNIIHDIIGRWFTRGIYGDEGCSGVIIYNNIIYNITNDAIYYWPATWKSGLHIPGYAICKDNICMYNIVFGHIYIYSPNKVIEGEPIRSYNDNIIGLNYIGKKIGKNFTGSEFLYDEEPIIDEESYIIDENLYSKIDFKQWGFDDFIISRLKHITESKL